MIFSKKDVLEEIKTVKTPSCLDELREVNERLNKFQLKNYNHKFMQKDEKTLLPYIEVENPENKQKINITIKNKELVFKNGDEIIKTQTPLNVKNILYHLFSLLK